MEIDKSQTKSVSRVSSRSIKQKKTDVISDDISMSQLELLANKKKLNKKSDEISLENVDVIKEKKTEVDSRKKKEKVESDVTKKSETSSTDSSSSDSSVQKRKNRKKVEKENKDNMIRKEKSELLFKLYNIIEKSNGRWSSKLSMDNTLEEIKSEFTRIKAVLDNEAMVKFCKHGLVMGIKGVEMINNMYDPIGVDLDGWSEAMSYNMATTEYDEVLSELCEKYKGTGSMSPEVKLLLMIIMSGAMFSFSKKAAKDPNTLTNLMGAFMKKSQAPVVSNPVPAPMKVPVPESSRPQPQPQSQQQFYDMRPVQNIDIASRRLPTMSELRQQRGEDDIMSEDSDDIPSKMRGPSFDSPDSANIEKIIQTMKQKNMKKVDEEIKISPDIEQILNETETSDDVIRNIPPPKTRGKGRPKKNNTKAQTRNI